MDRLAKELGRIDYGLDAPRLVRGFLIGGAAMAVLGLGGISWGGSLISALISYLTLGVGCLFVLESMLMVWSSRVGKLRARDTLLDRLRLRGDEDVLDIGCGRGLLMIGAAKRLMRGRAVGIDIWSRRDQAGNSVAATLMNAQHEGVADRIWVLHGDMRRLPFRDASFDAVVASLSVHNVGRAEERRVVIDEIIRVLKPGGKSGILDIFFVKKYCKIMVSMGMRLVWASGPILRIFPPARIVVAQKAVG